MKPKLHHRVCARPWAICWVIGTLVLWIPMTASLYSSGILPAVFTDAPTIVLLLIGYSCLAGIGHFVGGILLFWWVARVCRRINGGPYVVGDRVTILVGADAGITTTVDKLTRGQGGIPLTRVDLGAESREEYLDLRDDYTLLRVRSE